MKLVKLYQDKYRQQRCPECKEEINCPHCCIVMDYCDSCGATAFSPEAFILHTVDKYNGQDKHSNHTASLMVNGNHYASAHIDTEASDRGGDVAYLQLMHIPEERQNDPSAKIVSDFAKWVRYEWCNPDKQSDLPTLVRLIGFEDDENYETGTLKYKRFVVLWDATKITREHLAYKATHGTAIQETDVFRDFTGKNHQEDGRATYTRLPT